MLNKLIDQPQKMNSKDKKPSNIDGFDKSNHKGKQIQPEFVVYEKNMLSKPKNEISLKDFQENPNQIQKNIAGFSDYSDQPNGSQVPQVYIDDTEENVKTTKYSANIKYDNQNISCATPAVQNKKIYKHQVEKKSFENPTSKKINNMVSPSDKNLSSPINKTTSVSNFLFK